jgi:integrase/recombinase XerD
MHSKRGQDLPDELNNYLESYLSNLKRLNKSAHTIVNYRADLIKFFTWIHEVKNIGLNKVNGDIISEYKEFLQNGGDVYKTRPKMGKFQFIFWFNAIALATLFKKRGPKSLLFFQSPLSVGSRRRHLSGLKNFFQYLKETHEDHGQKFSKNPVKSKIHAIKLKDIDVISTRLLKHKDFELAFEKSFRTKDRLILLLLYYGGMRLSELSFLKYRDFDLQNKCITFVRKGGSIHRLFIKNADQIFSYYHFYISQTGMESEYLFHNKSKKAYSTKAVYNLIMKILERAEVDAAITPHSFRKACATNLYRETKDLLAVRDYLNHSDAKVTQTYIETSDLKLI